jgi:hypothetical protein
MCGFDAAIDKKGPALNGAGPFCFLDYAENAGPTLRVLSTRALPALGREGWGTRKIDSSIPAATSEVISPPSYSAGGGSDSRSRERQAHNARLHYVGNGAQEGQNRFRDFAIKLHNRQRLSA